MYKFSNFTERINAFRVIERLERMDILDCKNTENVKSKYSLLLCVKIIVLYNSKLF